MARPSRLNVDYFPHPTEHGSGMFYIENKYSNDGYAVWMKILERLGKAENHYLDLSNESELMFLAAKCKVSEDILRSIITDLTKLDHIHRELWEHYSIIWNQKFIDSIQDAYSKRNNKCISFDGFLSLYRGLGGSKLGKITTDGYGKPQSKVKERKVKESKEEKTISLFDDFRKQYPGTKRGLDTEFKNFKSKHKDWEIITPSLVELLNKQIQDRRIKLNANEFIPPWKNLQTWINNRCWEEEVSSLVSTNTDSKNILPPEPKNTAVEKVKQFEITMNKDIEAGRIKIG